MTGRPVPAASRGPGRWAPRAAAPLPGPIVPHETADEAVIGTGHLLDGKYLLGAQLGKGGMGVVYEATHVLLARRVAVKLIRSDAEMTERARRLFTAEGQNLASIAHPHVVTVHDFGFSMGLPYLVMEHLRGEPLDVHMKRTGRLSIGAVCDLARQVLLGLAAAHARGLVHRDLKPGNIFLTEGDGGRTLVKLIDFGLSTVSEKSESKPRMAGTPIYLPPEQARGEPVDARADIYALGATMYEALVGRPPLTAKTLPALMAAIQLESPAPPSQWRSDLSPEVDRLLLRALAKRREDRFSSAAAMLAALAGVRPEPLAAKAPYVLIADADPVSGEACGRAAAALGREGLVVRDGLAALETARVRGLPDLLVTKLSLPRMDGLELLRELRKVADASRMPAIVASRFPAIRRSAWDSRAELGVSAMLPDLDDEGLVASAMRAALSGEPPAEVAPTLDLQDGEERRLEKIRRLNLGKDEPPNEALQRLVEEVASAFRVPMALVSIILEDRQWFQAFTGIEGPLAEKRGTPRQLAFCNHVVEAQEALVVTNAAEHPVFREYPAVKSGAVGGYAGSPLISPTGEVLGTLCIVDKDRLSISPEMLDALDSLARRVAGELELLGSSFEDALRRPQTPASLRKPSVAPLPSVTDDEAKSERSEDDIDTAFSDPACAAVLLDEDRLVMRASRGIRRVFEVDPERLIGMSRDELVEALSFGFVDPGAFMRAVRVLPQGPFAARATLRLRPRIGETAARSVWWFAKPLHAPGGACHLEVYREVPRGAGAA